MQIYHAIYVELLVAILHNGSTSFTFKGKPINENLALNLAYLGYKKVVPDAPAPVGSQLNPAHWQKKV